MIEISRIGGQGSCDNCDKDKEMAFGIEAPLFLIELCEDCFKEFKQKMSDTKVE